MWILDAWNPPGARSSGALSDLVLTIKTIEWYKGYGYAPDPSGILVFSAKL
jgi:hypothetical protein